MSNPAIYLALLPKGFDPAQRGPRPNMAGSRKLTGRHIGTHMFPLQGRIPAAIWDDGLLEGQ